jgi:cell division protein FtsA
MSSTALAKTGPQRVHPLRPKIVAALDVGSTKISAMIGAAIPTGQQKMVDMRVKGFGTTVARGFKNGAVTSIDDAERSIRLAVDAAERMAGVNVEDIYVGVSGGRPKSVRYTGIAKLSSAGVRQLDIDFAISHALATASVGTSTVMHLAPLAYFLDGNECDKPPVGMRGQQLRVDVSLMTIDTAFLQNLSEAIDRAHLAIAGFVPGSHAAGLSCLSDDEMDLGCVVIDIGSATTSLAIFNDGRLLAAEALPLGGQLITHDIARGLCTNMAHAERLKSLYGGLLAFGNDEHEILSVPRLGEQGIDSLHQISRSQLTAIVRPRMEEILEHVGARIKATGLCGPRLRRAVLTGGGAALPGLRELSRTILGLETRLGQVPASLGLPEVIRNPGSAVVTGLLRYAIDPQVKLAMPAKAAIGFEKQQVGYARRLAHWLADSF